MSLIAPDLASAKLTLAKKYRGTPCGVCGSDVRYYRGGGCVECAKQRTAKWQKENPDVGRERARRHYQKSKKVKTAWTNDCLAAVRAAAQGRTVGEVLRLQCVRDLLAALGASQVPAENSHLDDPWGGL